jgi:[ribosomal protein S18]-alanine N-acetyltransferase
MPIQIRPADPGDLDRLVELENSAFSGDRMSRRSLRSFIASHNAHLCLAEHATLVAGYALVLFRPNARAARLYSIAVDPLVAGRGVGRALLAEAERAARARGIDAVRLEVREDNVRALGLYRSCGYHVIGRRETYYEDGTAALCLEKQLAESPADPRILPETIE